MLSLFLLLFCQLIFCSDELVLDDDRLIEKEFLILFYDELEGFFWDMNDGWLVGDHCDWFGIGCVDGYVVMIKLKDNNLVGNVLDFSRLERLEVLDLSGNVYISELPGVFEREVRMLNFLDISGTGIRRLPASIQYLKSVAYFYIMDMQGLLLPPELGNMTGLLFLSLENSVVSMLPDEIAYLVNLEILVLDGSVVSTLPAAIGKLSRLRELNLRDSLINEIPPEIGSLQTLEILDLSKSAVLELPNEICGLTSLVKLDLSATIISVLPPAIKYLTSLEYLDLTESGLWSLPKEIGKITSLRHLNLQKTRIQSLPDEIGDMASLELLDLSHTNIAQLPAAIGNLKSLLSMIIVNTKLSYLTPEIGKLENLEYLDISWNEGLMQIPPEIGKLRYLRTLMMEHCGVSALPTEFSNLMELSYLMMADTQITHLPISFKNLQNLDYLDISNSELVTFPEGFGQLKNLRILRASNTKIALLPSEIGHLEHLEQIYLNDCPLTILPMSFSNLKSLMIVDLSSTRISSLPEDIGRLLYLEILNLRFTKLTVLPDSIIDLSSLRILDLAHTFISSVPTNFGLLVSLDMLHLQNTKITVLCDNFERLEGLTYLDLSQSSLEVFPVGVWKIRGLQFLDISHTSVSILPEGIHNFKSLVYLNISHSRIALIPDQIGQMEELDTLDISYTPIDSIPRNISSLEHLRRLLARNTLISDSSVPRELAYLNNLAVLDFRNSRLLGIPYEIGGLENLEELYLSGNQIRYVPPSRITNLTSLTVLDLADNSITSFGINFQFSEELRRINLRNNSLSRFRLGSFNLPVMTVDVSQNRLFRLDFDSYIVLNWINISSNPNLRSLTIHDQIFVGHILSANNPSLELVDNSYHRGSIDVRNSPMIRFEQIVIDQDQIFSLREGTFCYSLFTSNNFEIIGYPEYYKYQFCFCRDGYAGDSPISCTLCSEKFGEEIICSGSLLFYPRDKWPIFGDDSFLGFTHCTLPDLCNVNGTCFVNLKTLSVDGILCRKGHTDRFCVRCKQDHWRNFLDGFCYPCNVVSDITVSFFEVFILAILVVLIIVIGFAFVFSRKALKDFINFFKVDVFVHDLGVIFTLIFFFQTINMRVRVPDFRAVTTTSNSSAVISAGNSSQNLFWILQQLFAMPLDCWINDFEQWQIFLGKMLFPVLLCIIVVLIGAVFILFKKLFSCTEADVFNDRYSYTSVRWYKHTSSSPAMIIFYTCFRIYDFFFFDFSFWIFEIFDCRREDFTDELYMHNFPWIKCDLQDTNYMTWYILGWVFLVLYIVVYLVILSRILWSLRDKDRSSFTIKFLYDHYQDRFYWYELWWLIRRLLVSSVDIYTPNEIEDTTLLAVLVISLSIHIKIAPFKSRYENIMEFISLLILVTCFAYVPSSGYLNDIFFNGFFSLLINIISNIYIIALIISWITIKGLRFRNYKKSISERVGLLDPSLN